MNLPATPSVDLLEDEKPPSLSRQLTSMKNHFTSFSGPKLSSTKGYGWMDQETEEKASSKANEEDSADDDEGTNHPPGVKAAKARSKKTMVDEKELSEFQTMWSIKKQDLALKERYRVKD
ncbi:hypothetical protein F2Q68_00035893 [Brassica cretica]|uniref:No apical meristem-associated C-terminal domain-containing protein n=1 Tax=Brassica cretica TaxID=69181 RepID=A0A8S9GUL4_BRACR|nr:hypothetical protein F2Q68_00035893 [Brassica cretica]